MKISRQECAYIMNRPQGYFYNYELQKTSDITYRITPIVKLLPYTLLFIPIHFWQALWCVWDGGLKEFRIEPRRGCPDTFFKPCPYNPKDSRWERADEIYQKHQ